MNSDDDVRQKTTSTHGMAELGHLRSSLYGVAIVIILVSTVIVGSSAAGEMAAGSMQPQEVEQTQSPEKVTVVRERSKFTAVKVLLPQYEIDRLELTFKNNRTGQAEYVAYAAPGKVVRVGLTFNQTYRLVVDPVKPANATHSREITFTPDPRDRTITFMWRDGDGA